MNYLQRSQELKEYTVANRRAIHSNPELGVETPETSRYIREKLIELGIKPKSCGKHGITALIGKNETGPVVMLRADIDALPMTEESGLPFASKNQGKAHCCGHDNHAAMLLTAARMLKENEEALPGRIKLMFQPGEETGNGCLEMIASGILENPAPSALIGMHVDAAAPLCQINWGWGPTFCSNDVFILTVKGLSCHGARPHQGKDAINCAAHLILSLEALIAREADPSETDILTVCSIESNSKAFNIFPESVILKGSLRTYNNSQRQYLLERMKEVCEYTAKSFRCTCEIEWEASMNAVILDDDVQATVKSCLQEALGDEIQFAVNPTRKMGSDDIAAITSLVPSGYFFIGAGIDRNTPYSCGQHNSKVVFNEGCLPVGAAGIAAAAEGLLKKLAKK